MERIYGDLPPRIASSEDADNLLRTLTAQHGPLMFHQSGGCCDGSAPMCFTADEFMIGDQDVLLGVMHDCPFYMSADQFEVWKHTQLLIDITKGRGASFSLEIPLGLRFVVKSRCFTTGEIKQLTPVVCGLPPQ
jgi:uncharacterized protein (DUF779 family)